MNTVFASAVFISYCTQINTVCISYFQDLRSDIIDEMLKENSEALATGHNLVSK